MAQDGARPLDAFDAWNDAPCGLAQTTANGLLLQVNATFCRWLGRHADELVGKLRLQDLFTMGGRIFHQTHWAPLLQMQGSVAEVKLEMLHREGHAIPMVMNAVRRVEAGAVVHHIAVYVAHDRDTYERELLLSRRRLEDAAAEAARQEAAAKDRALLAEQMIGIVSHDLRNPLSTIHFGVTLLQRAGATPQQAKVLDRMARAGERASHLIGDLLDFTQARLGKRLAVSPRPFRLHELVSDSVDELALAYSGRVLRHTCEGQGTVQADPDRLVQLLGNLVSNAMAYGRADTPIDVHSAIGAQGFTIAVHNQGEPIPADLQERLFLPLSQGTQDTGASRSIGLGLYIVSEIAKAHGGRMRVASTAAGGTTFTAEFPLDPGQA